MYRFSALQFNITGWKVIHLKALNLATENLRHNSALNCQIRGKVGGTKQLRVISKELNS